MANDWEQMLKGMFGDSVERLTSIQKETVSKLSRKVEEMAREAMREEVGRLEKEIADLQRRVTLLESVRTAGPSPDGR